MVTTVTLPVLGFDMKDGTVVEWLKASGETVALDEPLLVVEIDKGTVDVPAPVSGTVVRQLVAVGEVVAIQSAVAEIEVESGETT